MICFLLQIGRMMEKAIRSNVSAVKREQREQQKNSKKRSGFTNTPVYKNIYKSIYRTNSKKRSTAHKQKLAHKFKLFNPNPSHFTSPCSLSAYAKTSLSLNCFLNTTGEISYKERQMVSQIFGPKYFKDVIYSQNRRQKFVNRGALRLCGRALHSNLTKILLTYSVSCFNLGGFELCLGGLSPPKSPVATGLYILHWTKFHTLSTEVCSPETQPKIAKK